MKYYKLSRIHVGMKKSKTNCTCKWCAKYSPLCEKIAFLLQDNPEEKELFERILDDLALAETDAIFWKDKYYGTWPRDSAEDIQKHIEILQERKKELENLKK